MFPSLPQADRSYWNGRQTVSPREFGIRYAAGVVCADGLDDFRRNFRHVMAFSSRMLFLRGGGSWSMFPEFAFKYFGHAGNGDVKLRRQNRCSSTLSVKYSGLLNDIFRQFGVWVHRSPAHFRTVTQRSAMESVAVDSVFRILGVVAKIKMRWINAGRVVASMQNQMRVRVFSRVGEKSESQRTNHFLHGNVENAVAPGHVRGPSPAISFWSLASSFVYEGPELLDIRLGNWRKRFTIYGRHLSSPINGTCLGSDAAFSRHPGPFLFYLLPV